MSKYKFSIQGTNSIILHNNNIEERDRIEALRKKMKGGKPGDDRSPPESWKGYVYTSSETGNVCIPSENLLTMFRQGGVKVKVSGKETLKTHSQRILLDAMDYDLKVGAGGNTIAKADIDEITGEFGEHCAAVRDLGFRLLQKPCKVGTSSHIRVRPIFEPWSITGGLEVDQEDDNVLSLTALRDLFAACGRLIGLGDWRPGSPNSPGQYGRFTATVERAS